MAALWHDHIALTHYHHLGLLNYQGWCSVFLNCIKDKSLSTKFEIIANQINFLLTSCLWYCSFDVWESPHKTYRPLNVMSIPSSSFFDTYNEISYFITTLLWPLAVQYSVYWQPNSLAILVIQPEQTHRNSTNHISIWKQSSLYTESRQIEVNLSHTSVNAYKPGLLTAQQLWLASQADDVNGHHTHQPDK